MGRPAKAQDHKRKRWGVLNVTPAEREAITAAAARSAERSISAYLVACAMQTSIVRRSDHREAALRATAIEARLAAIAERATEVADPRQAGLILLALCRLERAIAAGRTELGDWDEDGESDPEGDDAEAGGDGADRDGDAADEDAPEDIVAESGDELDGSPDAGDGGGPC